MRILLSLTILFLAACIPDQAIQLAVAQTLEAMPTSTPYPTYTPLPTFRPLYIVITATSLPRTPTPVYTHTITPTPTITSTPTITPIPTETTDPLMHIKGPGIYLIGVDIAPGIWRSQGNADNCYWKRSTRDGDIIDNYLGMAGGTIYIAPTDFQVELDPECGTWLYLGPP